MTIECDKPETEPRIGPLLDKVNGLSVVEPSILSEVRDAVSLLTIQHMRELNQH